MELQKRERRMDLVEVHVSDDYHLGSSEGLIRL